MTIDVRLLAALNIGTSVSEVIELIEALSTAIEDGFLRVENDGDAITRMHLTAAGRAAWPRYPHI